jgi:hypothetical protein
LTLWHPSSNRGQNLSSLFQSLAAISCQYPGAQLFGFLHLNCHDFKVGTGTSATTTWLVNHYFAMRENKSSALVPPLSKMLPILAAIPIQTVLTGEEIICMVS